MRDPKHDFDMTEWTALHGFNQVAPRAYNRLVLCFEVEENSREAAIAHLDASTRNLGLRRPELTSLLRVETATALISKTPPPGSILKLDVLDAEEDFGCDYPTLKKRGFPASCFVNAVFDVVRVDPIPVLIIRAYLIRGGIILGLHLHHSVGDGGQMSNLACWLSAETRGDILDHSKPLFFSFPLESDMRDTAADVPRIEGFPERKLLSSSRPCTSPPGERRVGKIFLVDTDVLKEIRSRIPERPSTTVVLYALAWAHMTKARLGASGESREHLEGEKEKEARLFATVDLRPRVFKKGEAEVYFGNANEMPCGGINTSILLDACDRPDTCDINMDSLAQRLRPLTQRVQEILDQVDESFIRKRLELCTHLTRHGRAKDLAYDVTDSDKYSIIFNSWRYAGSSANQRWNIPGSRDGVSLRYPDCGRRAGGMWNGVACAILPARPQSRILEVMITVEESAMERLMEDEAFLGLTEGFVQ